MLHDIITSVFICEIKKQGRSAAISTHLYQLSNLQQYNIMVITESSSVETYVPVADFYAGKSIFLTGGMGFVGEVLLEKLLYSCPDIGNIYMLVREKKGVLPQDRLKSFFESPVFYRLTEERPENLKKVKIISGDLTQFNLGISSNDTKILKEEVSVVFHVAATVKFNEPLSIAVKINVEGTEEVLKLSKNMKKIEVFVYMSTIFANTNHEKKIIEEKLYPCPKSLDEVYGMIEKYGVDEVLSPEKLEGWPNSYTFTKVLAEHLIVQKHGSLPTIIVRPSIVTAAKEEPIKGWISNWTGPTQVQYLIAKGWCRSLYGEDHYTFEITPVDYVVNLTIVAAAKFDRSKEIEIYNSCSSSVNPLTLRKNVTYLLKESSRQKFHDLPFPGIMITTSEWLLTLRRFILQILPAYFADIILYIMRKPVRFVKLQRRLASCTSAIKYFSSQNWLMKMPNGQALFRSLNNNDKNIFPCDPSDINWEDYIATYFNGIKKYLLKEEH